jgi:hypothetical protein
MGVGVAYLSVWSEYKRGLMEFEERRLMIEKGMQPPALKPPRRKGSIEDSLYSGIIMVFLGIGLWIAYGILPPATDGGRGIIRLVGIAAPVLLLLGLGNLVYVVLAKRMQRSQPLLEDRNSQ